MAKSAETCALETAEECLVQEDFQNEIMAHIDTASRMALPLKRSEPITISSSSSLANTMAASPPAALQTEIDITASMTSVTSTTNTDGLMESSFSLTLMQQSSPPPHSYRHSRAYRHFKNPPQPHMCIRTTTEMGEELFINVLSWTRIVIPQEPSDPIPLYGGMRVPPGSPRSPPIVFAVMANPEVLKDSGRHSKDPEERRAMVELMCDFVEAMNPGVKLVRNALILKDRDISGELKDVWNAVQAQRDREREEQILQQRQQQHYHNITTQQMFPKSEEMERVTAQEQNVEVEMANISPDKETSANGVIISATAINSNISLDNKTIMEQQMLNDHRNTVVTNLGHDRQANIVNGGSGGGGGENSMNYVNNIKVAGNSQLQQKDIEGNDQIDATSKSKGKDETTLQAKNNTKSKSTNASRATVDNPAHTANNKTKTTPISSPTSPTKAIATGLAATATTTTTTTAATTSATTVAVTPTTKKEKLGGFLPNGCIFPRFKNNKNKDKDKDKESKSKDKEKTLLNALKKSKEKKVAPIEHTNEKTSPEADAKTQYEKNCINLENEVQKLDLNKIDTSNSNSSSSDNMFIKLKVSATSAAAK